MAVWADVGMVITLRSWRLLAGGPAAQREIERMLREKIDAGFELAGGSEVNSNPLDTHDHPEGVWTLPPDLALGERDRAKYLAIGESDRFTLKFVKPR